MKNIFLLIILFFLSQFHALSQHKYFQTPEDIDSLKQELMIFKHDTDRIYLLNKLSWAYRGKSSDSAMFYAQKALTYSRQIKFSKGESEALVILGFVQFAENPAAALALSLRALQVAEKNRDDWQRAWAMERIGIGYRDLKNYPKALSYLYQAKNIFCSIRDFKMETTIQFQLGNIYLAMNLLDSGFHYAQLVFEKSERLNIEWMLVNRFEFMGAAWEKKGNRKLALWYYQEALNLKRSSSLSLNARLNYQVARLYRQLNIPDSSIYFAKQSLIHAQQGLYYNNIIDAATLLAETYEKIDPNQSLNYYKITLAAKDSLSNINKISAMQNLLNFDEQERKYEVEAAQIVYKNKVRQYGLFAGLGIFLLIASILYHNNTQKQKANKVLETTLSNLKSTQSQLIQSEKMASLGELTAGIAHEIQNPLNFVNNFSEVNAELIKELKNEAIKGNLAEVINLSDEIDNNSEKITHHGKRADGIVKNMLQHSRSSEQSGKLKKEPTDINALADEYLRLAYHGLRAKDQNFNATLKTDFDSSIGLIQVIPQDIARAILNLITNAFYAVQEKIKKMQLKGEFFSPTVSVTTKRVGERVEIRIMDNGPGIPQNLLDKIFQPFFTTKPAGQGTGLGLSLSYDIIKAHGGKLSVDTQEGEGSTFIINIPYRNK